MRLTSSDREKMVRLAVADAFDKEAGALKAEETALARLVWEWGLPQAERDAALALAPGWATLQCKFPVNAGGYKVELVGDTLPVPTKHRDGWSDFLALSLSKSDEEAARCEQVRAFAHRKEDHRKRRDAAKQALTALVGSATSLKALREAWPEGEPYWSKLDTRPKAGVPAVRVQEVNKMLGLPRQEAA